MDFKSKVKVDENNYIGKNQKCFIVAEIGQNHNGDMENARELIDVAEEAGVSAVKFCKRHIPAELTEEAYNRPYRGPQSFGETYGEHREFLELSREQHKQLAQYAKEQGLIYFSSACDKKSVDDMECIGVPIYKIASRDLTNIPLVEYIAKTQKPVIMSTGMATKKDINHALEKVYEYHDKVVLLNCTSQYPCDIENVNMKKMDTIERLWGTIVGYSGHTSGIKMPIVAVARGAKVIEKHITLHRHMKGSDHAASLEPNGLEKMVKDIRNTEKGLGDGKIEFKKCMQESKKKLARSLVLKNDIKKGEKITEEDLTLKSPGTGIIWRNRNKVLGKKAIQDFPKDVIVKEEMFE
ncbi:N-acetylneuraminate synthase family protein [Salinibacter ruber]|uniref:N-acetylneuraminate synthase family protein n=1 Tax=Salinibacter ruber TaxID=146919 RepID=UPI0021698FCB|nr:N-acetylneuraminate synthase family protein [Salinibacter ruber]MCS4150717.1 sialic acid synthase [Salinibacter ruber]